MPCRKACPRPSSPTTCARPRPSCRPRARTAASPTSTSAPRAPRSAARSAARGNRRRPRIGLGRVAQPHAPRHQHHQLLAPAAAGPGHQVRRIGTARRPAALFQCLHKHRRAYRRLRRAMLHCFVLLTSSSPMSIDRPIHALHVLSAALALGMAGTAAAGVSYRLDRPSAAPGDTVTIEAVYFNEGNARATWEARPSWCCNGAARTARSCAAWRACRASRRAACPSTTSRAWPGRPRCPPARAGCRPFPSRASPP